ncbi:hypothetical protein B0J11DRAFT_126862 [Dendryphion nanum]|uniref:Uncharacterized protein n=1 Tax=Dendryphion nanum TaxID=256645 RepID=A0A9P9D9J1_9PLEO|nr:hypothetical protein B0J11DRAFT_126862 [Dendryphion nanum]
MAIPQTKFTSIDSSSGMPSPPNPTPVNDGQRHVDPVPEPDLAAVNNNLDPIAEDLNEAAENARFPDPPVQTPAFSPTPSVVGHIYKNRPFRGGSIGLSNVNARLRQLKIENRNLHGIICQDMDNCDHSHHSMTSTDDGGAIDAAHGTPNTNPRLSEYIVHSPDNDGVLNRKQGDKGGVAEKSYWAEEVMGDLERACMRLEQLAEDEALATGASAENLYLARLRNVIAAAERKHKATISKAE